MINYFYYFTTSILMTEYIEIADILFSIKDKLDDNEYLTLSNLILKAKKNYDELGNLVKEQKLLENLIENTREEVEELIDNQPYMRNTFIYNYHFEII